MSLPVVAAVTPGSVAARAGLAAGDEIVAVGGEVPRDVIEWQLLVDEPDLELEVRRGGVERLLSVPKRAGEPLGAEVDAALFDRVRTCDNHCAFCFIHQLPRGMRRSLYLKDDDYRLSFLYGNFTTLTRFTEADLERVVTERLSPLYVSIHATDPDVRAAMLRNRRGAVSLRWLRALLDHEIEVHGQVVVCPGVNDADVLDDTLCGVLDRYSELASVAVVPLGVSRHSDEPEMRPHTRAEAAAVVDVVEDWQEAFERLLGHRMAHLADEYYLLAGRPFPPVAVYGDFPMHEDGVGMARAFEAGFEGWADEAIGVRSGFFASVDGAPAAGYRAPRHAPSRGGCMVEVGPVLDEDGRVDGGVPDDLAAEATGSSVSVSIGPAPSAPVGVLTGSYGRHVVGPLVAGLGRTDVRVIEVENRYFGGNIGVTGLMVGEDVARVLEREPAGHRYLLPDVCLSGGRFLDGVTVDRLPRPVEVVPTDGASLRIALEPRR